MEVVFEFVGIPLSVEVIMICLALCLVPLSEKVIVLALCLSLY